MDGEIGGIDLRRDCFFGIQRLLRMFLSLFFTKQTIQRLHLTPCWIPGVCSDLQMETRSSGIEVPFWLSNISFCSYRSWEGNRQEWSRRGRWSARWCSVVVEAVVYGPCRPDWIRLDRIRVVRQNLGEDSSGEVVPLMLVALQGDTKKKNVRE